MGLGVKLDLLQFESAYLTDSSNLILQELSFKNSFRNLNLIMGEEIDKNWILSTEIEPKYNMYNYSDLKKDMLSNNTNIKNQFIKKFKSKMWAWVYATVRNVAMSLNGFFF